MKILLAVDESEHSRAAAQLVASQFRSDGAAVLVVHFMYPLFTIEQQEDQARRSDQMVRRIAETIGRAGFRTEPKVITATDGDIRDAILALAAEWHADLIVLGSHGSRGVRRFLLGSVAENVARHAACSVLIVKPPARQ